MKKNHLRVALFFTIFGCSYWFSAFDAYAKIEESPKVEISDSERISLARDFLRRMRSGFSAAEKFMHPAKIKNAASQKNILPEGERLIFEVFLSRNLKLKDIMFARVKDQKLQLSLKDFVSTLELPIIIDVEAQTAQGWYIRENKPFNLDLADGTAVSDNGEFTVPPSAGVEGDDIFIPVSDLEQWFDFEIDTNISGLRLTVLSEQTLPVVERFERARKKNETRDKLRPELPLQDENRQLIDIPYVDVATNSRYDKRGDSERSTTRHIANIRTAGDFAYGTLTSQTQLTNEDQITNIRLNYKQESLEPDLLGPLKAKRFEVGDVIQTRLPIDAEIRQELGARISNVDPLRSFTNPSTAITGTIFPGWDVELYRGNQFLEFQRVEEDGLYSFDNVILFSNDNIFKLVFYGPQGEVREEEISIPVDISRLAEGGGVYDISLTFDDEQTYKKNETTLNEDKGTPTLLALYEMPIGAGAVASIGLRSNEQDNVRNNVVYGGISKLFGETLINANAAIDDEADIAAELVARRKINDHSLISTTRFLSKGYDTVSGGDDTVGSFDTRFNATGPLPIGIGQKPRYSAALGYNRNTEGISSARATVGFDTRYKNFNFNEQLTYATINTDTDDSLDNIFSVTGTFGRSRLRLRSDYEIKPENRLSRVSATYSHDFTRDLDLDLELQRTIDPSLTEGSAQLNWQAGWARISPSVSYNSDNDFFAGLNTNFGLAREPQLNVVRAFDRSITSNGGISAFVFLDENGDGEFNDNDQVLEGVSVRALQNGGREVTNENGIAFFNRVRELKQTDVFVEVDSLQDPFWISGFDGVSVLPREGYVAEIQFPIHMAGELDGTLYARSKNAESYPLRGIPVHLYDADGKIEATSTTDLGGFYLFTGVHPGRYLLTVDHEIAQSLKFARPRPQQIEIGYEGTIIYGNDIFVDVGETDIPSTIISGLEDYKERHPHIDFRGSDYNVALNLGEYNSRLLMSTVWYRLHSRYRPILAGGQLMVLPQHSYADTKTGKHTLRVGFRSGDLDGAYSRCEALVARQISCTVEVMPSKDLKFAMTDGKSG